MPSIHSREKKNSYFCLLAQVMLMGSCSLFNVCFQYVPRILMKDELNTKQKKVRKPKCQTIFIYTQTHIHIHKLMQVHIYMPICRYVISLSAEKGLSFPLHEKYIHLMITEEQWRKLIIKCQDVFLEGKNKDFITFSLKCVSL